MSRDAIGGERERGKLEWQVTFVFGNLELDVLARCLRNPTKSLGINVGVDYDGEVEARNSTLESFLCAVSLTLETDETREGEKPFRLQGGNS